MKPLEEDPAPAANIEDNGCAVSSANEAIETRWLVMRRVSQKRQVRGGMARMPIPKVALDYGWRVQTQTDEKNVRQANAAAATLALG